MPALLACVATYQELREFLCLESLALGRKNELWSNNDNNRVRWGRCNPHFFSWSWLDKIVVMGFSSEVHFNTSYGVAQADLELKYDIFSFKVVLTEYLMRQIPLNNCPWELGVWREVSHSFMKPLGTFSGLLSKTLVVLSFMQICICGKPIGVRE